MAKIGACETCFAAEAESESRAFSGWRSDIKSLEHGSSMLPSFSFLFGAAGTMIMQTKTGLKMKGTTYREKEMSENAAPVLQRFDT